MKMLTNGLLIGGLLLVHATPWAAEVTAAVNLVGRPVPQIDSLPEGPYRALVLQGHELSTRTFAVIGPEVKNPRKRYAGNNLACTSCHQEGGAKPFAIPWVGVTATFPQYRGREDQISTVEERINGCMERSMNGKPLPLDAPEMKAFTTYIAFLSKGVPVGAQIEGAAVLQSAVPNRRADPDAGSVVYAAKCAVCHGADGLGKRVGQRGDAQGYTFPPVWGPDSFNNGAGMNRLLTTTRFIRQNMPLGASHTATVLNDDEAYDVTAFVLSKPRPVKAHLEADFPARWNKPIDAAFPPYMLGATADQHRYGPFPPLAEKQREMADKRKADMAASKARAAAIPASAATGR
ncbi:MAG: c-type cytochrome [Rubrivivax sp.]|nr:c-type cytochrome [Rubrivivax sp.]